MRLLRFTPALSSHCSVFGILDKIKLPYHLGLYKE